MERNPPAKRSAAPGPTRPRRDRLLLAFAAALVVHLVVVLGAETISAGLQRVRVALGLALPRANWTPSPRDDDWIHIDFELPRRPPKTLAAVPQPPTPTRVLRAATRHRRDKMPAHARRLLASRMRRPTGLVKTPAPAQVEPPAPQVEGHPRARRTRRWLHMRHTQELGEAHPAALGRRRPLDLVYRPAPGELRVVAVDKGVLRVAGRSPAAPVKARGARHDTGRWTPLPERLLVRKGQPRGRFSLDRRGNPVYAGVKLKRVGRGRWRYYGPNGTFNATIDADGQVTFRDLPSIAFDGVRGSPPLSVPGDSQARAFSGIVVGVSFTFDVTDAVMRRLGQDPYSAEKRQFARLSKAWRLELRAGFKRRMRREALARFGPQAGLCRRYRGLDGTARGRTRSWLFARWKETREDARGRPLRAAILDAIRRCDIRFPPDELARFNAKRRGRARFEP